MIIGLLLIMAYLSIVVIIILFWIFYFNNHTFFWTCLYAMSLLFLWCKLYTFTSYVYLIPNGISCE